MKSYHRSFRVFKETSEILQSEHMAKTGGQESLKNVTLGKMRRPSEYIVTLSYKGAEQRFAKILIKGKMTPKLVELNSWSIKCTNIFKEECVQQMGD